MNSIIEAQHTYVQCDPDGRAINRPGDPDIDKQLIPILHRCMWDEKLSAEQEYVRASRWSFRNHYPPSLNFDFSKFSPEQRSKFYEVSPIDVYNAFLEGKDITKLRPPEWVRDYPALVKTRPIKP